MRVKLAIVVSHPIPYFAAAHRALGACADVDLKVFFCCDWGISGYRDPQFGVDVRWDVPLVEGYAYEFLPIARSPKRLGFWEVDNPAVAAALSRFDPDVLLLHGYGRRTMWRARHWARRHDRPVLLYSDSSAIHGGGAVRRAARRFIVGRFYSGTDGALCVSDKNRAYHRVYGVPEDRLFPGVIPVEVDRLLQSVPDRARARRDVRARVGIPQEAFVAMLSGKYVGHKRPQDLLRAVDLLQGLGRPVWGLLVGDGPERPALERHLQATGTHAVLTGFVNQGQIGAYYAAADVVVSVSSRESFGVAIVEGAAFGLPLIVSDAVGSLGTTGAVRPGVNTLVFPSGDVPALATAIDRLRQDTDLYARMSQASADLASGQSPRAAAGLMARAAQQLHALGRRGPARLRARLGMAE